MSIAVRVSVWILGMLIVVSAAVAVLALMQKQTLQGQNQILHNQIADDESKLADLTTRANKLEGDAGQLNNKISQTQQDKAQIQSLYDDLKHKSDELQAQIDQANNDRDDWKNRVGTISRERDDLMQKLKNRPTQIVYKTRIVNVPAADAGDVASAQEGEKYWASVLKQKAALQVELEKEKSVLDQAALQVAGLKKQNSDLEVEVKQVSNEKDEIIQKIKYGQELADNLSVDLARSHSDQQAVNDRADKLKNENLELLSQIRGLSSNKLELERTLARLTDEKDAMQEKLFETESVIQRRIDDIGRIKKGVDKKISKKTPLSSSGIIELPPIIVNAPNQQQVAPPKAVLMPDTRRSSGQAAPAPASVDKNQGSIISINESNNFVIVDLGQLNSPVSVGNLMKVYRNSNEIATLEVIQVRRDICAADIKDKSVDLKVGDIVRF